MEYVEKNYTPLLVVGIGLVAKKLMKKDLVPVSGWKQMLSTYLTVFTASLLGQQITNEVNKNRTVPKPN